MNAPLGVLRALVLANGHFRRSASGANVKYLHAGFARGLHRTRFLEGFFHATAKLRFAWSGESG